MKDHSTERFSRLLGINDYPASRVANARVLVGGVGALGNELVKNLCLLGFRHLFLVDMDHVELSNLTRSVLFRERDIGRPKIVAAAETAKEIFADALISGHHGDIAIVGLGVFARMDLIFSDFDQLYPRLCINRAAARLGRAWIDAGLGLNPYQGTIAMYDSGDPDAPCFVCRIGPRVAMEELKTVEGHLGCQEMDRMRVEGGFLPTTPTTSAVISAFQTQAGLECLRQGEGTDNPWREGGFSIDLRGLQSSRWRTRQSPLCPYHAVEDRIDLEKAHRFADWRSDRTTLAEMFAGIRLAEGLPDDAVIHMKYPLVQAGLFRCAACEREAPLFIPAVEYERRRKADELPVCEACGSAELRPDPIFGELSGIEEGDFPYPEMTLERAGVRKLEIIEFLVETDDDLRFVWAEVTGDEARVFRPLISGE